MSATLDSHLFANYFGSCPALAAGGRTFPVEHHFLEDAHDLIGYHLDADSAAALRGNRDAKSRRQLEAATGGRNKQGLFRVRLCFVEPRTVIQMYPPACLLVSLSMEGHKQWFVV